MKTELKVLLGQIKWSQAKLSRVIGVSQTSITQWVNGRIETPRVVLLYLGLISAIKDVIDGHMAELD